MTAGSEMAALLAPTATHSERVRGLLALGLTPGAIALATGSSVSTVRNWAVSDTQPRADAAMVLDDLRTAARILLDSGLAGERIPRWLTSRDPERFEGARPIDAIRQDPMAVFAAAHEIAMADEERPAYAEALALSNR